MLKQHYDTYTYQNNPRKRRRMYSYDFVPRAWLKQNYLYIPGSGDLFRRTRLATGKQAHERQQELRETTLCRPRSTIKICERSEQSADECNESAQKLLYTTRKCKIITPALHGYKIPYVRIRLPDLTWKHYPAGMIAYHYMTGIWLDYCTARVIHRDGNLYNLAWDNLKAVSITDYLAHIGAHH